MRWNFEQAMKHTHSVYDGNHTYYFADTCESYDLKSVAKSFVCWRRDEICRQTLAQVEDLRTHKTAQFRFGPGEDEFEWLGDSRPSAESVECGDGEHEAEEKAEGNLGNPD